MAQDECTCPGMNACDPGRTGRRDGDCPEHGVKRPGLCVPEGPCDCDETVGFNHAEGTAICRRCGHTWRVTDHRAAFAASIGGNRVVKTCPMGATGFSAAEREAQARRSSVIAEAMLADAARVDPPRAALPQDSAERKRTPLCTGLLDYFPDALAAIVSVCNAEWNETPAYTRDDPRAANVMWCLAHRDVPGVLETLALASMCELSQELDPDPEYDWTTVRTLSDLFDVFGAALAATAQVSWHGNEKHNPGQPLHHARGKSMDHFDCIARHYVERGGFDGPMRHSACLVWRALAALQEHLEDKGAPKARGAK